MTSKANDLLRSAYNIAERRGENTNWKAFADRLREELIEQAGANPEDEQQVLRATCTPRTFRTFPQNEPPAPRVTLPHLALGTMLAGLLLVIVLLSGCGHVSQNVKEGGYQVGDISEGLKADRAWYCGPGMMGIRAVARFVVALTTGTSVPDLCKIVDVVTESASE